MPEEPQRGLGIEVVGDLAEVLAGRPLDPDRPRVVAVDDAVRTRLVNVLYVRDLTPIRRALAGLVTDGWLVDVASGGPVRGRQVWRYELTLPGAQAAGAD